MSILLLTHAGGSPGLTTTALAMALRWPSEVLLADCDPHANQTILAGHFNAQPSSGVGLASFASAARAHLLRDDQLREDALPLPGAISNAMFYPGFSHPSSASIFAPLWPDVAEQFRVLAASGTDVLVDIGRLGSDPPAGSLLAAADELLVVVRSGLPSLAVTRIWLQYLRDSAQTAKPGLRISAVVIGPGRPYSAREISQQFNIPVRGEIAWEPRDAEALNEGKPLRQGFERRPLARSVDQLVHQLRDQTSYAGADFKRAFVPAGAGEVA